MRTTKQTLFLVRTCCYQTEHQIKEGDPKEKGRREAKRRPLPFEAMAESFAALHNSVGSVGLGESQSEGLA